MNHTSNERNVHETLAIFFGEEWIEKQVNKVKLDGYHNMNPMNIARMKIHPIIKAIIETQIKLHSAKVKKIELISLGKSETYQELLHKNLTILESELDIKDIRKRLRDQDEFQKVEYEIAIASGYKRIGSRVEFIPRLNNERTGEFYIFDNKGNIVLVECKKKDITSPKQVKIHNWFDETQHLLFEKMKELKKRYGIAIYNIIDPEQSDSHKLKDEVAKLIASDSEGEFVLLQGKYKIILKKFCNDDKESVLRETVDEFANDADVGVEIFHQSAIARPIGSELAKEVFTPMVVRGYDPSDFIDDKVASIISSLKSAYGQLAEDKPNIVYIDLNVSTMMPERLMALVRKVIPEIRLKLEKDYSKISAVVLTNLKVLGDGGISGFEANEYVVLNKKAKNLIPNNFLIYGDIENGKSILDDIKKTLHNKNTSLFS